MLYYKEGVSELAPPIPVEELKRLREREQKQRALERAVRRAKRRAAGFSDPENIRQAQAELKAAQKELREYIAKVGADEGATVLKRSSGREKVYEGDNILTNGNKSGIIKPEEVEMVALENQRYGRNKDTLVNKTYIDGGEYKRKFDNATDNPEVNKSLYNCSKTALKHRSGTTFEDMYWIDSETGRIVAKEIDGFDIRQVNYSPKTRKVVDEYPKGKLITVHTHPSSMPPSAADFNSSFINGYKCGFIACHDGKVYGYTSEQMISEELYSLYIGQYIATGASEFEAQIKALQELSKNHLIDFWEVQ